MTNESQPTTKPYKGVIREHLDRKGLSIRGLFGDQTESTPDTPSYSTADNFIRKGTGNIDTAWLICQRIGITLNEAFIPEDMSFEEAMALYDRKEHAEAMLSEIINLVIKKGQIRTVVDIAEILLQVGQSISAIGYKDEAAKIIRIATDTVEAAKRKEEVESDEQH